MEQFTPEQIAYLIKIANQGIAEEQAIALRQAEIDQQQIEPTDTGTTTDGVPTS